jgi:hypothetical protein
MRTHLKFLLCSIISLLAVQVVQAEIYKTVDKQGRIVYSDQPPVNGNAKIVELPSINSLPPAAMTPDVSTAPDEAPADVSYQLSILNPASGVTLQADERSLDVFVSLDPALQEGHLLVYFLDGNVLEKTTSSNITLTEPPRGEHKLHVEVMSKYGKSLGQSQPVTIIVLRPIAHQKPGKVPRKH